MELTLIQRQALKTILWKHLTNATLLSSLSLLIVSLICSCTDYKKEIDSKSISYARESFLGEVEVDNRETVKLVIKADMDLNSRYQHVMPLKIAAAKGDIARSRLIIDKGADVNTTDDKGDTALMQAAVFGNVKIVKMLIDKGADVNAKDNRGETALMQAAVFGNVKIVKMLIDKGADVNTTDDKGDTALMQAAFFCNLEAVKVLIDKGADVNARNNRGDTALSLARLGTLWTEEKAKGTRAKIIMALLKNGKSR